MTRKEKLAKWGEIYAKAMGVIEENLGVDKDHVYAACHTIQTASREIGTIEHAMRMLGEIGSEVFQSGVDSIGWGVISEADESNADA